MIKLKDIAAEMDRQLDIGREEAADWINEVVDQKKIHVDHNGFVDDLDAHTIFDRAMTNHRVDTELEINGQAQIGESTIYRVDGDYYY